MKVFVAGASGVVGRPLVRQLLEAGHEVTALSRSADRAQELEAAGASTVLADVYDAASLREAVVSASPEVVVNQLTDLPDEGLNPRHLDSLYGRNDRMRSEGAPNLLAAAQEAGARRLIAQSVAFFYAPEGDWVKDEEAPLWHGAPSPFGASVEAVHELENGVLETDGIEGVVLRYGAFYGPGTWYARDGALGRQLAARRMPIIGSGEARTSFIHVEDAAAACVAFIDRGSPGVYNVTDDEPAEACDWIPCLAEAIGAKPPRRVPRFIAQMVGGGPLTEWMTTMRAASNAKLERELGLELRYRSWRQGFLEANG